MRASAYELLYADHLEIWYYAWGEYSLVAVMYCPWEALCVMQDLGEQCYVVPV